MNFSEEPRRNCPAAVMLITQQPSLGGIFLGATLLTTPWHACELNPEAQPPASRTLATSSHLAPPPLSPEATVRQAACPAHPPLHHPSPPRGVSSGRAGTPCCSWLCAPPARPRTGLGQQLALRKCLLRECAGLASLMHASSRPAKEDSFPIHI